MQDSLLSDGNIVLVHFYANWALTPLNDIRSGPFSDRRINRMLRKMNITPLLADCTEGSAEEFATFEQCPMGPDVPLKAVFFPSDRASKYLSGFLSEPELSTSL